MDSLLTVKLRVFESAPYSEIDVTQSGCKCPMSRCVLRGNYEDERPYVEGDWCSRCPEKMQKCENNLCGTTHSQHSALLSQ